MPLYRRDPERRTGTEKDKGGTSKRFYRRAPPRPFAFFAAAAVRLSAPLEQERKEKEPPPRCCRRSRRCRCEPHDEEQRRPCHRCARGKGSCCCPPAAPVGRCCQAAAAATGGAACDDTWNACGGDVGGGGVGRGGGGDGAGGPPSTWSSPGGQHVHSSVAFAISPTNAGVAPELSYPATSPAGADPSRYCVETLPLGGAQTNPCVGATYLNWSWPSTHSATAPPQRLSRTRAQAWSGGAGATPRGGCTAHCR